MRTASKSYETTRMVEQKAKARMAADDDEEPEIEPADRPITFKPKPEERKGGDKLSAFLAFVPMDVKELSQTRFESYLVNDSNYYLRYVLMTAEGEDLNDLEHLCVQLVAYKREKHFLLKSPVNAQVRVDTVKFYKLHAFRENDFFEQPALIYTLIENDVQKVKL